MRIGLIIADFEMSFANSFKHTARVKYEVDFNTSVLSDILIKLDHLEEKVKNKQGRNVKVGYEIEVPDVINLKHLLNLIMNEYQKKFERVPPDIKIWRILQLLKELEIPDVKELSAEILKEILTPKVTPKQSKKEQITQLAGIYSSQRVKKIIIQTG